MKPNQSDNAQEPLAQMIEAGHKLIRLEGAEQRQISKLDPRDEKKILDKLLMELEIAPRFAEKVYYSIPYKNNKTGTTTKVEGVSIKGAMALQRLWGNCASAGRIVEEANDRIICEGVFMDYETNSRVMRQVVVSRFYTPSGTNNRVPRRADQLEIAIAAGISKAIRNAVNNGLPEYLKMEYFAKAKSIAGTEKDPKTGKPIKKPLATRVGELFKGFEAQGVTREQIVKLANADAIDETVYEDLLGILNALEEGHVTKESLLNQEKPTESTKQEETVKLENLI